MRLGEPAWLSALWALPVLGALLASAAWMRRRAARRFAGRALAPLMTASAGPVRRAAHGAAILAAAGLIVLALARPQWNPREETTQRSGRDVVFIVDVSRSMLTPDLAPSRLERAKVWIKDLVASLGDDRVALVAFAGSAVVKCPLTVDTSFFRLALDGLGPDSVSRGGTLIGDAIRKTLDEVVGQDGSACDIILITDGEDHESFPVEAAQKAGERGVRIIALGLGERGVVPGVTYERREVVSTADPGTLARIAGASAGGAFLNVGTGTIDLERVYADLAAPAKRRAVGVLSSVRYTEGFQLFLAAAAVLLCVEVFSGERRRA